MFPKLSGKKQHKNKNFQPRKKESDGTEQQQTYTVWTVTVAPLHKSPQSVPKHHNPNPVTTQKSHTIKTLPTNTLTNQPTNQPTNSDGFESIHSSIHSVLPWIFDKLSSPSLLNPIHTLTLTLTLFPSVCLYSTHS